MPRPLACLSRGKSGPARRGAGRRRRGLVAQGGACWAPTPGPASAPPHSHPGPGNGLSGHLVQTVRVPGRKHESQGQAPRRGREGQLCFLCEQSAPIPGRPPTPTTHGCSMGIPRGGRRDSTPRTQGCGHWRRVKRKA